MSCYCYNESYHFGCKYIISEISGGQCSKYVNECIE